MKKFASNKIGRTIINLLITLAAGGVYFYVTLSAINLQDTAFYSFFFMLSALYCGLSIVSQGLHLAEDGRSLWQGIKAHCAIPVFLCLGLVAVYGVGAFLSSPVIRAGAYRELLTVETGEFEKEVDEISFDQIPMLDEDSAKRLGDRKMGELADMVSQFEVAADYTQINYKGRPVRVTPLLHGDLIKWFNNRSEGLPAYLIIDMVTQNVELVRVSDVCPGETGMKYSTAEHFGRNLIRHLRFNYPTFMFDPAMFEIDEEGVPYWVCPRVVKRVGLLGGKDIDGAVLVNAVTGESLYYGRDEVPSWVDRVYTSEMIIQQYDYYGTYVNGFVNSIFGQRDCTVTTAGYNYIAIGDDVHMYTGITSLGADESNIGFILVNQRTKDAKFYSIAGAEEYSAMASARGAVQHLGYTSTFPLLLNIASSPTYIMALKDSAGLVKMYAMVSVQQYNLVATAETVAECDRRYLALLQEHGLVEDAGLSEVYDTITGEIEDLRSAVIDGNTVIYLKLEGSEVYYTVQAADNPIAVIINIGDRVRLRYLPGDGIIIAASELELIAH